MAASTRLNIRRRTAVALATGFPRYARNDKVGTRECQREGDDDIPPATHRLVVSSAPNLNAQDTTMTASNNIFDAAQRDLLRAALNRIVPASGDMPGAGDLGIGAFVEGVVAGSGKLRRAFLDGLVQIELAAQQRGGSFISLSPQAQSETLQAIEVEQSEFFQTLVTQTYRGYYTDETVFDLLKYRAPNRADYNPTPLDESLLEPVRQRGQMWTQPAN